MKTGTALRRALMRPERVLIAIALAMLAGSTFAVRLMAGPRCSGSHGSMNVVGVVVIAAGLCASVAALVERQLPAKAFAVAEVAGAAALLYYAWATFTPMFDCGA